MKQIVLNYLKAQLEADNKMKTMNSIAEEDRVILDEHIASLTETIEAIEALEDAQVSQEVVDELKASLETLNETVQSIKEKLNQNKTEQAEMENIENAYLKSKNAIHDFAQTIRNTKSADEFANNWAEVLKTNGITVTAGSEEAFLPQPVLDTITDVWDRESKWLADLHMTGAKRFYCRYNTSTQTVENSRAKGWKSGTKATESLTVAAKLLEAQFIYKIMDIDNKSIWDNDESLISFVVEELVSQILWEIKQAVLVGDGRASDSDYKIDKIEAIARTTTDAYVTVSTETANGFLLDDIKAMMISLKKKEGRKVLVFMSETDLNTLERIQASETSSPTYMPKDYVEAQLGENVEIVTTDLLGASYKAIAFIPDEYYMVGDSIFNPRMNQWEDFMTNTQYWRFETVVGGGVRGLKSAAVLKANA